MARLIGSRQTMMVLIVCISGVSFLTSTFWFISITLRQTQSISHARAASASLLNCTSSSIFGGSKDDGDESRFSNKDSNSTASRVNGRLLEDIHKALASKPFDTKGWASTSVSPTSRLSISNVSDSIVAIQNQSITNRTRLAFLNNAMAAIIRTPGQESLNGPRPGGPSASSHSVPVAKDAPSGKTSNKNERVVPVLKFYRRRRFQLYRMQSWEAAVALIDSASYRNRCIEVRRRISQGVVDYVKRESDSELSALLQPIFTKKKLVIWSADHHIGPISDIRSLIEPLGVEFLEHTLYFPCERFCTCEQVKSTKVLNQHNVLKAISIETIDNFIKQYTNDSELKRADALLMCHSATLLDIFVKLNTSIIFISSLRYDTTVEGDPKGRDRLTGRIQALSNNPTNLIGANNRYDSEYIRYFTGEKVYYIPSFCGYTVTRYNSTRNSYLKAKKMVWSHIADYWNPRFDAQYRKCRANFSLETKSYEYSYTDISTYRGILHIPYQVSVMSFFEHYQMDIPLFVPSFEFLMFLELKFRVVCERTQGLKGGKRWATSAHPSMSSNLTIEMREIPNPNDDSSEESMRYWFPLADFYHFPHIIYFDSVEQLVDTLHNKTEAQLVEISSAMHKFNVSNLKDILRFWRRRLIDIAKYSQHNPH